MARLLNLRKVSNLAAFTWDFDDESTDNTNWPAVTHSFAEPGAYLVQLTLTDDNECTSLRIIRAVFAYVSTTPSCPLPHLITWCVLDKQ